MQTQQQSLKTELDTKTCLKQAFDNRGRGKAQFKWLKQFLSMLFGDLSFMHRTDPKRLINIQYQKACLQVKLVQMKVLAEVIFLPRRLEGNKHISVVSVGHVFQKTQCSCKTKKPGKLMPYIN